MITKVGSKSKVRKQLRTQFDEEEKVKETNYVGQKLTAQK